MYDYYGYEDVFAGGMGVVLGITLVVFLIMLAIMIPYIIGLWKVFKKANKPGWAAIVPFYGDYVLVETAKLHWMYFLLIMSSTIVDLLGLTFLTWIASIAALVARFNCYYNISKAFNKSIGFAICMTLFPFVCVPILGFSKDCVYDSSVALTDHGIFNKNDTGNSSNSNNYKYCTDCGARVNANSKYCTSCGKEVR